MEYQQIGEQDPRYQGVLADVSVQKAHSNGLNSLSAATPRDLTATEAFINRLGSHEQRLSVICAKMDNMRERAFGPVPQSPTSGQIEKANDPRGISGVQYLLDKIDALLSHQSNLMAELERIV